MNQKNRVLGRTGARELTPGEAEAVCGSIKIYTICTPGDGDCGSGCDSAAVNRTLNVYTICTGRFPCGDGDCA